MMRHARATLAAWSSVWLVLALTLTTTTVAHASTHFAIISAEHTNSQTTARLEVTAAQPDGAQFTVFPAGSPPISDTLPLNANLFVSSTSSTKAEIANLFTGSGAATALVSVQLSQVHSNALLHQISPAGKVTVNAPPIEEAQGFRFTIPIGDLQRGTVLLVGNPNPQAVAFGMRYGTMAPEPDRVLQPFAALAVEVTNANMLLVVEARDTTLPIIAQLMIDTGKISVIALSPLPF